MEEKGMGDLLGMKRWLKRRECPDRKANIRSMY